MELHVGQKVVCVDANLPGSGLVKDRVYIVGCVYRDGISVVEIPAPSTCGYFFRRFRPAVERKTDISLFTEMLTKTGVDA